MDRFSNFLNSKLPRFNSRYWNPGSEDIDCFVLNRKGENNYVCPPISLIPRVILHMKNFLAVGTLIVPLWLSAPLWPMLTVDGIPFKDFVISFMDIPTTKEFVTLGFAIAFLKIKTSPPTLESPVLVSLFINLRLCFFLLNLVVSLFACSLACGLQSNTPHPNELLCHVLCARGV